MDLSNVFEYLSQETEKSLPIREYCCLALQCGQIVSRIDSRILYGGPIGVTYCAQVFLVHSTARIVSCRIVVVDC